MNNPIYDLIIIGGGPGGLSASIYAARANLKTILLEENIPGGQINSTNEVDNYLGIKNKNGSELALDFYNHAKTYDLEIISKKAIKLNKINNIFNIHLSNGHILASHSVILATGGAPRKLEIPGENEFYGSGVSYCASCDGYFFRNKTVLVVGGGETATEESLLLSKICKKVYLVHRKNSLTSSEVLQKKLLSNKKIFPIWNTTLTNISPLNEDFYLAEIKNIKNNKTEKIEINGIFIFIGYKPNNQLVPKKVQTNTNGTVLTNEECKTSIPGLYAIGDLREKPARQIILSAADGCNASLSAAKYIQKIKKTEG